MGWLFGRRKSSKKKTRRKYVEPPMYSEEPLCAYVTRISPKSYKGVALPKKLGRFDFINDIEEDLIPAVCRESRGGVFRCRIFLQFDKRQYLGTYTFHLSGEPWIDGEPIRPRR